MERHGWFGWERVEAPRATREQLLARPPAAHVDLIAALSARGGGAIDMDTARSPGPRRRRCAPRAAPSRWSTRCWSRARPVRRLRAAPARPPRRGRRGRWASASSTTSRSPRRTRGAAHGVERVLILDWDVHHGNGTNDIFHADPAVLFGSIHEWPLYPGTGPATDVGSAPGRASRSTCPCRAGRATTCTVAGGARGRAADPRLGAGARARLGRVRRAPRRPARDLPRDRGGFAGDDGVAAARVRGGRRAARARARGRLRRRRARRVDGGAGAGAGGAGRRRRPVELAVHPLAADAGERLARCWPAQFGTMRRM